MDALRRTLLKGAGATGAIAAAMAAGVLKPSQVLAAEWNRAAFDAKDVAGALKGLAAPRAPPKKGGGIKGPPQPPKRAGGAVDVSSSIPNTLFLAVLVDKNPLPLSAAFDFANGALPELALRLKLGQTSLVEVVAKTADGKFYRAKKEVKVTVGGCGG